ncbi:MAG: plasmid mobilization relaxosome protein MobC [Clostridia bacterium]|nr:plasmid mobilization relaxosome protein MobC [Clostridia bacterium]
MLKRSIQIIFRVNAEEQEQLKTKAKKCGLSVSAYLRFLIRGYVPREQPSADYTTQIRELRAIGNNMKQIAARANATGFFLKEEYDRNAKALKAAVLDLQKAVTLPVKIHGNDEDMGG